MKAALAFLLVTVALAGCADESGDEPHTVTDDTPDEDIPLLHGWVFDQALVPLDDVEVEILEAGHTASSNAEGFYAFSDDLPLNEPLILVARLDGYKPSSQQVTLQPGTPIRLNFTLEAEPVLVPDVVVLDFDGFLSCQYNVELSGEQYFNDCSGGTGGDIWQFAVGPNLAGVVIEIGWTANTELSRYLHGKVETSQVSDQTIVLSETTAESVLRLQVAEQFAKKYYPEGGIMQLTVNVDPANAEQETEVGASIAVSQDFKVFASLFYVEPPPQGYTFSG